MSLKSNPRNELLGVKLLCVINDIIIVQISIKYDKLK